MREIYSLNLCKNNFFAFLLKSYSNLTPTLLQSYSNLTPVLLHLTQVLLHLTPSYSSLTPVFLQFYSSLSPIVLPLNPFFFLGFCLILFTRFVFSFSRPSTYLLFAGTCLQTHPAKIPAGACWKKNLQLPTWSVST